MGDLVRYWYAGLFLFASAYTLFEDGHVRVDVFYTNYPENKNLTITGTNGKSTTAKILFDILKKQKKDVRLTGNIGNPILD